jgi:predicted transcriptional regulator
VEPPRPAAPERPDLYVIARFLDRLRRPDVVLTRSKLQVAVRVNYDLFRSYMVLLEQKGFIRMDHDPKEGKDVVRLTQAGRDAHAQLVGWIERTLGDGLL